MCELTTDQAYIFTSVCRLASLRSERNKQYSKKYFQFHSILAVTLTTLTKHFESDLTPGFYSMMQLKNEPPPLSGSNNTVNA